MAALTVNAVTAAGFEKASATPDVATATTGDTFNNNGKTMIEVKNGSGSAAQATISNVAACNQGFSHDLVLSIPAGENHFIGPLPVSRFGTNPTIIMDDETSITYEVYQM